jgi:Ni/Co efflux regulator RcnB
MTNNKFLWKKILSAALVSTFAVAPVVATMPAAHAADHSRHDRDRGGRNDHNGPGQDNRNHDSNNDHDRGPQRHDGQSTQSNQSTQHDWNRGQNSSQHDWNRGPGNPQHDNHDSRDNHDFRPGNRPDFHPNGNFDRHDNNNWRPGNNDFWRNDSHYDNHFRGNFGRDDNWHRDHGYVRRGTIWYWHDHDDDWWISNGYFWNGAIWALLSASNNNYGYYDYGPFRSFTGIVTRIDYGDGEFDLRMDGETYNVYINRDIPYRLREGDLVEVHGQRYGRNDIRNADFDILRGR